MGGLSLYLLVYKPPSISKFNLDLHQIDSGWGPAKYPLVPGKSILVKVVVVLTRSRSRNSWSCDESWFGCHACKARYVL